MEDFILTMELLIDGYEMVKDIPIELSGCRSYEIVPTIENKDINIYTLHIAH